MNYSNFNIPFPYNASNFMPPSQINNSVFVEYRYIIEVYKDEDPTGIIYPFDNNIHHSNISENDIKSILFKIVASDTEYSNNCINDITFAQNDVDNISIYIKNKLVLNAMKLCVFECDNSVYYRGYVFKTKSTPGDIRIYISKMDNPYNKLYELSINQSDYAFCKKHALDYIDNLLLTCS